MSVFSVTSIDRLIEPAPASSSSKSASMERESLSANESRPPFSFYPPLYVTPTQQRPPSPSSFSPSPYVLNYKRRCPVPNGLTGTKGTVSSETIDVRQETMSRSSPSIDLRVQVDGTVPISMSGLKLERFTENPINVSSEDVAVNENSHSSDVKNGFVSARSRCSEDKAAEPSRQQDESEVFDIEIVPVDNRVNSRASEACAGGNSGHGGSTRRDDRVWREVNGKYRNDQSVGDGCEGSHPACSSSSRTSEEFFDAPDSPFDDSSADDEASLPNFTAGRSPIAVKENIPPRLREEIARRIRAEEALVLLRLQWNEMARRCSLSSLPCEGVPAEEGEAVLLELFCDRLSIARLVAGAVASGAARAVKDEELESIVTIKNREISRLRDKLQYYELINHEMSQRNQEAIEIAQRRKRRCRKRRKWALGCLGAAFCIGTTGFLCCKFFPWEQARSWTTSCASDVKLNSADTAST